MSAVKSYGMKTSKSFVGFLLLFTSIAFVRCTPDQDFSRTTKDILSQGTWSVDYYFAGQDKTAQYNSYQFSFVGNGMVSGTNGSNQFQGNWALIKDVNGNDVIHINLQTQEPFLLELNELWKVADKSPDIIAMNGDATQLRLRKL